MQNDDDFMDDFDADDPRMFRKIWGHSKPTTRDQEELAERNYTRLLDNKIPDCWWL